MADVAQLVELWIVIPLPPSNISDLTLKPVRTNCGQNKEEIGEFTWRMSGCEEWVGVTHRRWWGILKMF